MSCNIFNGKIQNLRPAISHTTAYRRTEIVCAKTLTRDNPNSGKIEVVIPAVMKNRVTTHMPQLVPGKFGRFGGKYVPETLIACLNELEAVFNTVLHDREFQEELAVALRDYVGRETPLYFAERLTNHYKNEVGEGPEIYLKREDLNHCGAHKMNNSIAQAMIAKRLGFKNVVAATGAGHHGVATAAACAKLSLKCTVFMGTSDMQKQSSNVRLMNLLGAEVKPVEGNFKDASSEAIRQWVGKLETSYYLTGTVVGPHPCPSMVREFQSVIGKETRRQAMEKWGGKPDVLVACVGSGSNALGLFSEFINDNDVRLIGVEAAGFGLDSGKHSATLAMGEVGAYHGAITYLLQDDQGQIVCPHSIGVGIQKAMQIRRYISSIRGISCIGISGETLP
ncbi:tryptophan synthase beta chain 2, chloroplastic-like isoform X2 [Mercurialis annua]|uniref:tryptophan synthase beta chain 2, chloroplastic-like isoform X2 n=1 Tax=Mercurialis annua TaxID=3986 RepID=UPI002160E955|nr:tryptophan synthase beta chain 2, chloroplastic-like isoform X2 [Mercurialis annua]